MGLLEGADWAVSQVDDMLAPEIALNKPPKTAGVRVSFQWRNSASKKLSAGRPLLSLDGIPIHSHPELQLSDVKHMPVNELSPRKQKTREQIKRTQSMMKNQVYYEPGRTISGHSVGRTHSSASAAARKGGEETGGKKAGQEGEGKERKEGKEGKEENEGKEGKGYLPSVVKHQEGGKGVSPTKISTTRLGGASSSSPGKLNTSQTSHRSPSRASPTKERALSPIKVS
jgi:hypothetical protein